MAGKTNSPAEIKTDAGRFPLVRKLIQFADIRLHYKDTREAFFASNRQAGSYRGLGYTLEEEVRGLGACSEKARDRDCSTPGRQARAGRPDTRDQPKVPGNGHDAGQARSI